MNNEVLDESFLWSAFKLGDESAFAEIYKSHYQALYSYGRKILPDAALVEDAIQELFITLWRTRNKLTDVYSVKFYLFRCLRRDIHKQKMKYERIDLAGISFLSDLDNQIQDGYIFSDAEEESMLVDKLKSILLSLPQRQFEAINLRYYENFSNQEIAEIMGVSEKTVRNTLYNALLHLRKQSDSLNMMLQLLLLCSWG